MKKFKLFRALILIMMSLYVVDCSSYVETKPVPRLQSAPRKRVDIQWETDPDTALLLAIKKHKPLFIYFYTPWCQWCKKMSDEVFNQSDVIDALNSLTVPFKVDIDASHFDDDLKVTNIPTMYIVFVTPDNISVRFKHVGFMNNEALLNAVTEATK